MQKRDKRPWMGHGEFGAPLPARNGPTLFPGQFFGLGVDFNHEVHGLRLVKAEFMRKPSDVTLVSESRQMSNGCQIIIRQPSEFPLAPDDRPKSFGLPLEIGWLSDIVMRS
jgi:hypothetical protein